MILRNAQTERACYILAQAGGEKHKQKEQLNFQVFRHKSLYCVLTLQLHNIKKTLLDNIVNVSV